MPEPEANIRIDWHEGTPDQFVGPYVTIDTRRRDKKTDERWSLWELSRVAFDEAGDDSKKRQAIAKGLDFLEKLGGQIVLQGCGPNESGYYQILIPTPEDHVKT